MSMAELFGWLDLFAWMFSILADVSMIVIAFGVTVLAYRSTV